MRFVIVAPYYHPYQNPRAYRWTQISKYLADLGHDITIITSTDHPYNSAYKNIEVIQTGFSTPDKRWSKDKGAARSFLGKSLLKNVYRCFVWPDESASWIKPGQGALRRVLANFSPDVVISVAHPFSSHCVVFPFSKEKTFQWWLDIGDPFLLHDSAPRNNSFLWKKRNHTTEEKIFQAADMICVTNDKIKDKYQELYPSEYSKFRTIGPLSSPLNLIDTSSSISNDAIQLGYFGTFYRGVRSPCILSTFRKSLNSSNPICWNFFGEIRQEYHREITQLLSPFGDKITFHNPIDRSEVLHTMNSMDYLINISNQTSYQLPSKLVDYLASQRPIINISKAASSNSAEFLKSYPGVYYWILSNPNPINIELQHPAVKRYTDEYSTKAIGQSYIELYRRD